MGLLERVAETHARRSAGRSQKGWSEPNFWDLDTLRWPFLGSSSLSGDREEIENDFEGYIAGVYKRNGPIFALMMVRQLVFSEARFMFRRRRDGRPGGLFATPDLRLLEQPWPNGTTGDLLSRVIQDADLAGNAYVTKLDGRLRRLRPDWVTIVMASESEPELFGDALDAELLGYWYSPRRAGARKDYFLLPDQVAHFAPIPDPAAHWRGMSWITPVLQEISGDLAATKHKLSQFRNGATPTMVVRLDASVTPDMFKRFKALMDDQHKGADNAGKTLYLGGGADVTPLTFDLQRLDFRHVQGAGESRLASAAGVPPIIVGFSEGLSGSSLNAGNYGSAKRRFVDATMRPLWRNVAGSLATLVPVPSDAELWWDDRDIAFLREDARDRADIEHTKASTIRQLVDAGYTPESVVAAVEAEDMTLLEHSGLYSVQLQPAGRVEGARSDQPPGDGPTPPDPAKEQ
ncbi:phage portal protein [Microbispora sp. SCL1-1]|uniref:phage portal protein n=1 Tax=unclassified Microbispora TaxID=2614687 RepID=UPI00115A943B|nr:MULTISPECIES: phage portal protein [unclassified Microbispora]NJP24447.1 phage portal protein [Microbispora sp. CL1-1]TQS14593.1 phage portal protein [Microbispora sp. SCL1-1]